MINQQKKPQNEQGTGTHPTAYIPLAVWQFGIGLVSLFLLLCFLAVVFYHHASMQDFMSSGLTVFFTVLKVLGVLLVLALAYIGYRFYHDFRMNTHERKIAGTRSLMETEKLEKIRLQNEQLRIKNEAYRYVPEIIKYAIQQGHNIEYSATGELRVQNYLSNIHAIGNGTVERALLADSTDFIPEPYKFSDVLQNWQPSRDGILLAKGRELITVPIGEPLCHTTFTSNTDGGKTNNERMLLIQLAYLQQCIFLCDRNYQPFREDRKLSAEAGYPVYYDYRPVEKMLACEPIVTTQRAVTLLKFLYSVVEQRRLERRKVQNANAIVPFKDKYLVFDELPAFASEDKEIMILLGRLLREARQYGVFVIAAAQDLLNQTLGNDNGAVRDNLLTNFYGGGDMTTARLVLNLAKGQTIDETGLGRKGVTYLRAKGAGIERVKARTPLSDDVATHMLLDELPAINHNVSTDEPQPYITRQLQEQAAYPVAPGSDTEPLILDMEPLPAKDVTAMLNTSELDQVVAAWNDGYRSIGKVMQRTGLGQNRSRTLIAEAKYKELISDNE